MTRIESRRYMAAVIRRGQKLGRPRRMRLKLAMAYWRQEDNMRRTRR